MAEAPPHLTRAPADLVDGPRVARGHEETSVRREVDRVDMEIVEGVTHPGRMRLGDVHMVEALPLEEHAPAARTSQATGC